MVFCFNPDGSVTLRESLESISYQQIVVKPEDTQLVADVMMLQLDRIASGEVKP